jgi:uncharacterized protein YqjF (DUF2071 family)
MMSDILRQVDHRPWPLPTGPWVMAQSWHDLLFAHWPIGVDVMRALVPPQLELDTFDGEAWVGVVPFRMSGVRPRGFPTVPWLSAFPELNVRTYVKSRNPAQPKPGVYFFSLEAANPIAVAIARALFKLPYFNATMRLLDDGRTIRNQSRRIHRGAPSAEFVGQYAPIGEVFHAQAGSLEQWLTERYSLYTVNAQGRSRGLAYIGEIHHQPWPLQRAEAEIQVNTMAAASQILLPDIPPLLHFARRLDVVVWLLRSAE